MVVSSWSASSSWSSGISTQASAPWIGPTGDLGDRGRVVAGDHLELDALLLEEGEDLGSIGTHGVFEQHEAHRRAARRQLLVVPAVVGAGDEQDAQAGGGRLGGPGPVGFVIVVEEDVGGTEVKCRGHRTRSRPTCGRTRTAGCS